MSAAAVRTRMLAMPDGRGLCVEDAGPETGPAILVHTGTPNSRHLFSGWITDAAAREVRLIAWDRPGYGDSTPHPGRSVAAGAADAAAVADTLGLERFATWGLSGGGPYALACAALLPEQVVAAATIGSLAPWGSPGLDFFAGMGEDNAEDIELYFANRPAARRKSTEQWEQMRASSLEQLRRDWATLVSPADAAVLAGPFGDYLVDALRDGLAESDEGWWEDGVSHLSPWGFDLASIRVPVKIWHGGQDRFVPLQHGEWLARQVPHAVSAFTPADGHLEVVADRIGEVHEWLHSHF